MTEVVHRCCQNCDFLKEQGGGDSGKSFEYRCAIYPFIWWLRYGSHAGIESLRCDNHRFADLKLQKVRSRVKSTDEESGLTEQAKPASTKLTKHQRKALECFPQDDGWYKIGSIPGWKNILHPEATAHKLAEKGYLERVLVDHIPGSVFSGHFMFKRKQDVSGQ